MDVTRHAMLLGGGHQGVCAADGAAEARADRHIAGGWRCGLLLCRLSLPGWCALRNACYSIAWHSVPIRLCPRLLRFLCFCLCLCLWLLPLRLLLLLRFLFLFGVVLTLRHWFGCTILPALARRVIRGLCTSTNHP